MGFRVGDNEIENRQIKKQVLLIKVFPEFLGQKSKQNGKKPKFEKKFRQTIASQNHQSFAEFLRQNSKQIGEKTKLVKKIRQFTASQILAQFLRENNAAKILVKNTGILKRKS